ncbi:hypothetical protein AYO22_06539 [Fonsecaea multimorphosa]|nr:hypothetical protein AYO22_06539 [Fonsecaea multimorphosa]
MAGSVTRKRKASSSLEPSRNKRRPHVVVSKAARIIERWLQGHPEHESEYEFSADGEELSSRRPLTHTPSKNRGKYALHYEPNYLGDLEARGSSASSSPAGLNKDDASLCEKLVSPTPMSSEERSFMEKMPVRGDNLESLSDLGVFKELFDLILPSAVQQRVQGGILRECFDLNWANAVPVYGPFPRPDHTYGLRPSNLTPAQKRKLNIMSFNKSYLAARYDIWFNFLTSFVKSGTAACDIAERAAMHAMTVALRGIVDLYRRANRVSAVYRRADICH